jgi:hypothetical protein
MTMNAFCHLRGLNRFFFLSASGLRWRRLSASIARRFRSMTAGSMQYSRCQTAGDRIANGGLARRKFTFTTSTLSEAEKPHQGPDAESLSPIGRAKAILRSVKAG